MSEKNIYGLSKDDFYKIIHVLEKHREIIEKVSLFGSRARGHHRPSSDIDLAIFFRSNNEQLYKIIDELTEESIIYTFDIIDYKSISNEKLKSYIETEGKTIFATNNEGQVRCNMNKINDKLTDLAKAIKKLHESLERDPSQDDIVIDATIQRFEFSYELSWKLMKAFLEYSGHININSPRSTMKIAFKEQLIKKGEVWLKMLEDRNRTSHTYDEEIALEIYKNIKQNYITLFDHLLIEMKKRVKS
jgi:nucleotidyltransferase substrate binding protein (TIGR01987 family)